MNEWVAMPTLNVKAQRFAVRRAEANQALRAYGWLVALLAMGVLAFALWPFTRLYVEAPIRNKVRSELGAAGLDWVQVRVEGREVTLGGLPRSLDEAEDAVARARAVQCATWFGTAPCVAKVVAHYLDIGTDPPVRAVSAAHAARPRESRGDDAAAARAEDCNRQVAAQLGSSKVQFGLASPVIRSESAELLDALARTIKDCALPVVIEGHTDTSGQAALNERLSVARAQAVREALVARGVAPDRMWAIGFGSKIPVADNTTPEGREKNRRIEVKFGAPPKVQRPG